MAAPKPQSDYNCSQAELYSICDIGWDSCENNLADFTTHKTFYNSAYVTAKRAQIQVARLLPAEQARYEPAEVFGIRMRVAADAALLKWNTLRSYIEDGFAEELVKAKLEAAGYFKYEQAARGNWSDLNDMMVA